jgi:hypothetical protein
MRTILFDYKGSKIDGEQYAQCLRVGNLLSSKVLCMGPQLDMYPLLATYKTLSVPRKMRIMSKWDFVDKEFATLTRKVKALEKQIRYKNGRMIVANKRVNDNIHRYFDEWVEWLANVMYAKGFPRLQELEDSKIICHADLRDNNPELRDEETTPLSEWFQLLHEEENQGDMVMLPADFTDHPTIMNSRVEVGDPGSADLTHSWFHHCFTLPNLASLQLLELDNIRKNTAGELQAFITATNNWIDLFCIAGQEQASTLAYFNNDVLTASANLQETFSNNRIVKHQIRTTSSDEQVEVWMGEVPVQLIWKYYKEKKVIPKETWANLQKAIKEDDRLTRRWPVITLRFPGGQLRQIISYMGKAEAA